LNVSKVLTTGSALTFDGTNLGLGASSPTPIYGKTLQIASGATEGSLSIVGSSGAVFLATVGATGQLIARGGSSLVFGANDTEQMRLTSTGLGIGTSSPAYKLSVSANTADGTTGYAASFYASKGAAGDSFLLVGGKRSDSLGSGVLTVLDARSGFGNGTFGFYTEGTERARITSGGNFLVSTTSTASVTYGSSQITISDGISTEYASLTSAGIYESFHSSTSLQYTALFKNTNGTVGSISTSGSATTFSTSSDYRLKNTIAPMTGALAKVAALKPVTYKWNVDGSDGEGFIAHELAEVCPHAVTGDKDAVDANGKPIYQGIDTSFLIATLTAAIQELKAEFDAYKASHP